MIIRTLNTLVFALTCLPAAAAPTYGLYINPGAGTPAYGVYDLSGGASYFANSIGVGTTAPAAKLEVVGDLKIGNSASACAAAFAGLMKYASGRLYYCDGSNWQQIGISANPTNAPPGTGGIGYFVMTAAKYPGNLNGLTGANSICQTELVNNSWKNKPGTITTSKIFAFLCDQSSCFMPLTTTTYYYATAGDMTAGGSAFTTDGSSQGPNDQYQWSATDRFNTSDVYWSGRNNYPVDATFVNQAAGGNNSCNNWSNSTTSYQGLTGSPSMTNFQRWQNTQPYCNVASRLICVLNP